ncbi:phosphoribosylformylglycinamidine synthase [Tetranychus urticae]|uniref:Phosphoribosylformylglycinamidine synthase n=1 Tax=Tetranychus urticae TaxID=32264 RepID=T1KB48_TETUR|nr:phosphoribosylformylglycinamidine synthase [Tetranychus urticae]
MSSILYYSDSDVSVSTILKKLQPFTSIIKSVESEICFHVNSSSPLSGKDTEILEWVLGQTSFTSNLKKRSNLQAKANKDDSLLIEIGPLLKFASPYSSNAVAIFTSLGLNINRVEKTTIYLIKYEKGKMNEKLESNIVNCLHDRMTQQRYSLTDDIFKSSSTQSSRPWTVVDIMGKGKEALKSINDEMGLSFDDWDIEYYTKLFKTEIKRNPTSVECFDLAQSNSEHSRHWFFRGRLIIDGEEMKTNLFKMIKETQTNSNKNNIIAFSDNSSAIRGFNDLHIMIPKDSAQSSTMLIKPKSTRHIVFTAETHNFPTGVAPFQGATTGTGGRIRDVQATGRGAHVIAGTAGYSFGNLLIPGYPLDWESTDEIYPNNFAKPLEIAIEASNGASDYGNKFGEPVIAGFARSFGMRLTNGERWEWIKPIMFSGGIGSIESKFCDKNKPAKDMLVTKIGGPVYRIGVGGGAASSIQVQGDDKDEQLNLEAVQRGDPEMEQKLNRLIRGCIERPDNPIQSIHDQGAGGNGNVLKEIVEPNGAVIYADKFTLGDPTIGTLELWGAEYQESNAILVKPEDEKTIEKISKREKCPVDFVGTVTTDGLIRLVEKQPKQVNESNKSVNPVELDLKHVLGDMPPKTFKLDHLVNPLKPLTLPTNLTLMDALNRVLRLPSVASKRYLTNKVDRSVTGLIAQQQCVGELGVPLADYGMIALSYFDTRGAATSIGEQPIKGLIDPEAGARLSVTEALTNLMFACITNLADVKCSGNWMWAAKLEGEGAKLVDACRAMCNIMSQLNIAVDGGKDSLSMAAKVKNMASNKSEVVKSPGTLVISTYAPVPDITFKVTPVMEGRGKLVHIDLSGYKGKRRTGGSALAQVYGQLGNLVPDVDDPSILRKCFPMIQDSIRLKEVLSGHDISDGGLITTLLEMAFATNCGLTLNFTTLLPNESPIDYLLAEEVGIVVEVSKYSISSFMDQLAAAGIPASIIGEINLKSDIIDISFNGQPFIKLNVKEMMDIWEETSFELEKHQANPDCVEEERRNLKHRRTPLYALSFDPTHTELRKLNGPDDYFLNRPKVAVIREEGINGDREMIASLHMVGFEVIDLTVTDLLHDSGINLNQFRGLVFPGGFSFADVLGSAKGWAATLRFNENISNQLNQFVKRKDTFSLGVCNGCQLLALLGWIGNQEDGSQGTQLTHNNSQRFESRFVSVKIKDNNNSIMLKGMSDSVLGVWVAHGEGKFIYKDKSILDKLVKSNCVALTYVDDNGVDTESYPMNPNGSALGIAGLTSYDGRHLAMMPHPERCTQLWQWPYVPKEWKRLTVSPWCKMFYNAYEWCLKH